MEKNKYPTMDEREPSACVKRTADGFGKRSNKIGFWAGMNERDETDPATMQPVGRMISEGFRLLSNEDDED